MKTSIFLSLILTSNFASAGMCPLMTGGIGGGCGVRDNLRTCAPEVQHGNVEAVDRALKNLAQGELKNAEKFDLLVVKAGALPEAKRLEAYLGLMGVQTDEDIVAVIGAREIDAKYVDALAKNAELTTDQSHLVLDKVSKALLGERK